MTELEEMTAAAVPRPAALCRRMVSRGAPIYGFVFYAILYLVFVINTVVLAVVFGYVAVLRAAGHAPQAGWAQVLGLGLGAAAIALTAWPFARWVKRRRRAIEVLARDGVFVTGRVTSAQALHVRGTPFTHGVIAVELAGEPRSYVTSFGSHRPDFAPGAVEPVLVHPSSPGLAITFPIGGRAFMARG